MSRRILFLISLSACELTEIEYDYILHNPPSHFLMQYEWTWENCASSIKDQPVWRYAQLIFYIKKGDHLYENKTGAVRGKDVYLIEDVLLGPNMLLTHEFLHVQLGVTDHPPIFAQCESLFNGVNP